MQPHDIDDTTLAVINQQRFDADLAEIAARPKRRGRPPQGSEPKISKGIRMDQGRWEMLENIAENKGISMVQMLGLLIEREWCEQLAADEAKVSGNAPAVARDAST